jgi:hypothetical protein
LNGVFDSLENFLVPVFRNFPLFFCNILDETEFSGLLWKTQQAAAFIYSNRALKGSGHRSRIEEKLIILYFSGQTFAHSLIRGMGECFCWTAFL